MLLELSRLLKVTDWLS